MDVAQTRPATQSTSTELDVNKCPLCARMFSLLACAIPLPARAFRSPMPSTCLQVPCLPIGLTVDIMANRRARACYAYWGACMPQHVWGHACLHCMPAAFVR